MKKIIFQVLLIGGTLGYGVLVFAHSTGINGATRKNGNGCTCHVSSQGQTGPSPSVVVAISGPDTLTAGQTSEYQITIQGGPAIAAGTNIAASSGTLDTASFNVPRLFTFGGELTHAAPAPFSGTITTFRFRYTAPQTAGTVTLFANGNSVNNNGTSFGDEWNFAPDKQIVIRSSITALEQVNLVPLTFFLGQNYPNPFNPFTTITYQIPFAGSVSLRVFNVLGKEVAILAEGIRQAGMHSVNFDASALAGGMYFYRIMVNDVQGNSFTRINRMMLVK